MDLIGPADLAAMRAAMAASLSTPCTIRRQGAAVAHPSGRALVDEPAAIPARCTVSDNSAETEAVEGGKLATRADVTILLPLGTQIRPQDRVTVGADAFEILAVDGGRSRALCVEAAARRAR